MRLSVGFLTAVLVAAAGMPAFAQPEATPLPLTSPAPSRSPASPPSPSPAPESAPRPVLSAPLTRPAGARPRLRTDRPADAVISRRGVELELWVPRKRVKVGSYLPVALRVTNHRGDSISHGGRIQCPASSPTATLDIAGLFDEGVQQSGRAARFKQQFLEAARMSRYRMVLVGPHADDCLGSVGTWENVAPGQSFTVRMAAVVRYPWRAQPLPSGTTRVTAHHRFWSDPGQAGAQVDMEISAPVRIAGHPVTYPSPQALADAALEHPEFRAWVESRWKNVSFSPNINANAGFWSRDFEAGPAPPDTIDVQSQVSGGKGDRTVANLRIDPWTARILDVGFPEY